MKYFVLVLVILVCGLIYVRLNQPAMWNEWLVDLKAPGADGGSETAAADEATNAPPPPPPPPAHSTTAEVISPDSTTHLNPDHIHSVAQPGDAINTPATNAPDTNAPSTTAPVTNAPATNSAPATP